MRRVPASTVGVIARRLGALFVACLLLQAQTKPLELVVLTSGTFTAAHLELAVDFERSNKTKVTTATTSMGVGADSIPSRLKRGDIADVVIVAAEALDDLIKDGLVIAGSRVDLARSRIGMAVRAGAPKPDIGSVEALKRALLDAKSVAISSSVSGDYFSSELFPRLGIADQMAAKIRRSGGERIGALIVRGEAEIGFQQMSELLSVKGIDVVGPLPAAVQRVTVFAAGVAAQSRHPDEARAYIRFLASPAASEKVRKTGLESSPQRTVQPTLQDVMQRAAVAAASFERAFAAVVADEHFVQRDRSVLGQSRSRRETRSDLLLVLLPGHDGWLPFRDVYEVDGRAVRDRTERLQKLFIDTPQTAVRAATQISNESSRYNIGSVVRTINVPTFGLLLLNPAYLKRFEFRKRAEETISGVATWRIVFEERAKPTVVRTLRGDDVPLQGSLWIEPDTGRVIKTLVKTIGTPDPGSPQDGFSGQTLMWVQTTFAPSDTLGLWAPATMTEWARAEGDRSVVEGTAAYSRFRRFTVKTSETFDRR
jgi:molybdate transport system substrate-binding protein